MTQPSLDLQQCEPPRPALAGVIMLLVVLGLRALVSFDPMPGWGGDPLELESPIVGLTPMGSLALDAVTLGAAGLIMIGMARRGHAPPLWQTVCMVAGIAAVALHARVLRDASMDNLVLGASWVAAFFGAFAAIQAARDPMLRRLMVAGLLGLIAPLVIKGVVQYFIEQPESMQEFTRDKERILSSNGWTTGSSMALAYERRLSQPEATGWFGLSNVFATLAAASLTALLGLTSAAVWLGRIPSATDSERQHWLLTRLILALGSGVAIVGVWLAGSKGGIAASALGVGLVVLSVASSRIVKPRTAGARTNWLPRAGSALALLLPLAALAAVALRGIVGERIHELSLLFRWFYLETATKIFAAHPLLGTGPDGFKDAYMLLKPAASPEDISSPHSIFFDLAARLGVGGIAWGCVLVAWMWCAGRSLFPGTESVQASAAADDLTRQQAAEPGTSTRSEARLLLIVIAIATSVAAILERPGATITSTLVRAGGVAGFMLVGVAVLRAMRSPGALRRYINPGLAAAAIAGFTHTQIELTGVTPGANLWLFLLIAAAAGVNQVPPVATARRAGGVGSILPPLIAATSIALLIPFGLVPAVRWELVLRQGAHQLEDLPSFTVRARAIAQNKPLRGDTAESLAADLSKALGAQVDPRKAFPALAALRYNSALMALDHYLVPALDIQPRDSETVHAAARLMLEIAAMDQDRGEKRVSAARASQAEALGEAFSQAFGPSPAQLAWLGMLRRSRFEIDKDPANLSRAIEAWEKAAALAPHEPLYAIQLARANAALNRREDAAKWAQRALEINQEVHLDPLRQFSQADGDYLRGLVNSPPDAPPKAPVPPSSPP